MTPDAVPGIRPWLRGNSDAIIADLCALVSLSTVSPYEEACFGLLREWCESLGMATAREPIFPGLENDADFTRNDHAATLASRASLRARWPARDGLPTTLFSAHVDVVPASAAFAGAFSPAVADGTVTGRGAADTKNNIVMLLWALRAIRDLGLPLARNVACDFVIEEEIGGNGALSTIRHGIDADEVIVLEPTSLVVHHGHRGYLTFEAALHGAATHVGGDGGSSAIDLAYELIGELRDVERALRADADAHPAFGDGERVVRLNVGRIEGGEWHGSLPEHCTIGASIGYVPGRSAADVSGLVRAAAARTSALAGTTFRFDGLHNDAYVGDPGAPVATRLRAACAAHGIAVPSPGAWNVSCDARLYHHRAGLPAVVFGSGDLAAAHTAGELVRIDQVLAGIAILVAFLAADVA